jgi:hypothetical protein
MKTEGVIKKKVWLVGDIIGEVFIIITLKLLDCDPV